MAEDAELKRIKERMLKNMMTPRDPGPLRDGVVVELDGNSFDAVGKASKPVLVDFWADWCAPCKTMKPVMDALAGAYSGRAYFAKVNVDANQGIALSYGVRSIPNFVVFKGGRAVDRLIGAIGRPSLEAVLNKHIL
jgi:thioredoxin 1